MGLDEEIQKQRSAAAAAAASAEQWKSSGVSSSDPEVTDPPPQFAQLVTEARRRLKYDSKVFVGAGPDGILRLAVGGKSKIRKRWFDPGHGPYPKRNIVKKIYNASCASIPVGDQHKDSACLRCYILSDGRGVFPDVTPELFQTSLVEFLA